MQLLKKWPDNNGISQKEFAGMICVSSSAVYRVVTVKPGPSSILKKMKP